jgi:hypothetical protein
MRQFQLEMTRYNRSDMDIYGNIGTSNQLITQASLAFSTIACVLLSSRSFRFA